MHYKVTVDYEIDSHRGLDEETARLTIQAMGYDKIVGFVITDGKNTRRYSKRDNE